MSTKQQLEDFLNYSAACDDDALLNDDYINLGMETLGYGELDANIYLNGNVINSNVPLDSTLDQW